MGRPCTSRLFKERIERIHSRLPDAAIGVDTLVGFPGETEEAFQNTYSLIESLPVSYLHVFPFSAREKTPAWSFPQKVADDVIKRRCRRMRILGHFKKGQFYRRFIGRNMGLLIEGRVDNPDGMIKGMTNNYIPVHIPSGNGRMHDFTTVEIERVNENNRVYGRLSG
jgi:threonylcarbamoyladenosine tRNA methylthiotransferase MtaB